MCRAIYEKSTRNITAITGSFDVCIGEEVQVVDRVIIGKDVDAIVIGRAIGVEGVAVGQGVSISWLANC